MSYTKGPWRARTKETKHHIRTDIQAKIGNSWKTLFVGNYYANEEDNANLIASCHELVEALDSLVKEVEGLLSYAESELRQVVGHTNIAVLLHQLNKGKKALTNAKGGQA